MVTCQKGGGIRMVTCHKGGGIRMVTCQKGGGIRMVTCQKGGGIRMVTCHKGGGGRADASAVDKGVYKNKMFLFSYIEYSLFLSLYNIYKPFQ